MTSNSLNLGLNNNVGPTTKVYCLQELLVIEQMTISYFIICILNNHTVFSYDTKSLSSAKQVHKRKPYK